MSVPSRSQPRPATDDPSGVEGDAARPDPSRDTGPERAASTADAASVPADPDTAPDATLPPAGDGDVAPAGQDNGGGAAAGQGDGDPAPDRQGDVDSGPDRHEDDSVTRPGEGDAAATSSDGGDRAVSPGKGGSDPVAAPDGDPAGVPQDGGTDDARVGGPRGRLRTVAGAVTTVLAVLLVFAVLAAPNRLDQLTPTAFLRVPVEALAAGVLLLVLRGWARRAAALVLGVALGLLAVVKLLDMGMSASLARPFDLVLDWVLLDDAYGFVTDSVGRAGAVGAAVGLGVLVLALLVLTTRSVLRLARLVARHDRATVRVLAALVAVWVAGATIGVPVADSRSSVLVGQHVGQVGVGLRDRQAFTDELAADAFRDVPGDRLLTGLRGKDVVLAFVESYGRDAVEDPQYAPRIGALLDGGTRRLAAAGYAARSGFLTSPTTGGGSWLAHDTLLSGLWVDNQQRHLTLLASDRLTLNGAFRRAGWDTVGVMPAATAPWPEGAFFDYERYHDAAGLGYRGPKFSYAPMPDQYTLAEFQRRERATKDRAPIMAEIPMISSHSPWAAIPRMLDWDHVGDGSIYRRPTSVAANPSDVVGRSVPQVRAGYRQAVEYSLNSLISYVETYGDDNLVLVFLGDHQPAPMITGEDAGRDVPVTIVARDPAVLARVDGWGWHAGLRPGPDAPVWRMDAFRDRFLTAFGPQPPAHAAPPPR
ncbi:sulfatase [Micromonospora coxensis]|uniref:sulfatase n=1 Tax=Micromonospora coxensis TaxID=356852 RepID=UPI00342E9E75